MFDRFSDDNKWVMSAARKAAAELGHDYIGTEHMLLGLCARPHCTAVIVLDELGVQPDAVRAQIESLVKQGSRPAQMGQLPFTPRGKRALELSMEVASHFGHSYIGTGHLLIGLIEEKQGVAARSLRTLGVEAAAVRSSFERLCPRDASRGIPRTMPAVGEALAAACAEAERRGHADIDVAHVLLGLLESDSGFAAQLVRDLGLDVEVVRARLRRALDDA